MKTSLLFFWFIFCFFVGSLSSIGDAIAQTQFQRAIGGTGADFSHSILQTTDGGYVVAGYTKFFGAGSYDIYLVGLDANGTLSLFAQDSTHLILDEPCDTSLPHNFRKSGGYFTRRSDYLPDTTGLALLNASGSGQFCKLNVNAICLAVGRKELTVIDLRQESHGFVNQMPVSWYGRYDWANVGLSLEQVEKLERHFLDSLRSIRNITLLRIAEKNKSTGLVVRFDTLSFEVQNAESEQEFTTALGFRYFRITVTDHRPPLLEDVDRFIEFVRRLSPDEWIHFHCHAGDGRTTTFMAMYDMLRNAKRVSFEDIIMRQYLLGGINLADDEDFPEYDKQWAIQRTEFLRLFYDYCRTNTDNFATPYSAWLKR